LKCPSLPNIGNFLKSSIEIFLYVIILIFISTGMSLTIYVPKGKSDSKAYYVFAGCINGGWPNTQVVHDYVKRPTPGMFWGFVGGNMDMVYKYMAEGDDWYFTDMPYFHRWSGFAEAVNPNKDFYWRMIRNRLHAGPIVDRPSDRFNKLGIDIKPWREGNDTILICPSSDTMTKFNNGINAHQWTLKAEKEIEQAGFKSRVRDKPRGGGTSGPDAALVSFAEDVKDVHAVYTTVSMAAVEAAILGVPVFCSNNNAAAPIASKDFANPIYPDREKWLYHLAYNQFTPDEIKDGLAYEILTH